MATQSISDTSKPILLLGTFGPSADLHALLKLRSGQTKTVSRGDRVDGQTVLAIEEGRVGLSRNGTVDWLNMPQSRS